MKITSYLVFNGEAEEAAMFYAELLGGKVENLYRYSQMPPMEGFPPVPESYKEKVMHCCVLFPGGSLSAADTLPSDPRNFGNGGHMMTLHCDSAAQTEAAFAKLTQGAQRVACPLGATFYAKLYGEVVDRYGILWAVMYEE
jgi:PhnB protein